MPFIAHSAGPIAIDFGTHAVRVAQHFGRGTGGRATLSDQHVYPARPRTERAGEDEITEAVRGLLRRNRYKGRRVVTALSARDMTVKNIRLPQMPEEELETAVRFEALERIPGLDDESEIRFFRVGVLPGRPDAPQEVIVLAATGEAVRGHLGMIEALGLESVGLDPFASAVMRPFVQRLRRDADGDRVTAVADIGRSGMRFMMARGRGLVFAKSFDWGGDHLDALAAERTGVPFVEAGAARRQASASRRSSVRCDTPSTVLPDGPHEQATRGGWERIAKEIGLCLRYYAVTFRGPRPEEVTCVGGEALDPAALDVLSQLVGAPCRPGRPMNAAGWGVAGEVGEGDSEAEWATVVGLALRPIGRAVGVA